MTTSTGLLCRYQGRDVLLDPERKTTIGTGANCDIALAGVPGGGPWATIRMMGGWCVHPLDGTEVAVDGGPWSSRPAWLKDDRPTLIRLRRNGAESHLEVGQVPPGQYGPVPRFPDPAPVTPQQPPTAAAAPVLIPVTAGLGKWITIGRDGDGGKADLRLRGLDVALLHAKVRRQPDGSLDLRDLSHGLGVFVDGLPMLMANVPPGGSFFIGHHRLMADAQNSADPLNFTVATVRQSPILECHGLMATYRKKKSPSLVNMDFTLNADEFLTVIGPSSAGKSTLFRALLGEVDNVEGAVGFAGDALSAAAGLPNNYVSFVPQDDHLPSDLTTRQAIWFAARLRLSPDAPRADLSQEVDDVMSRLALTEHAGKDVGDLSGGTRKRVSVALELLSNPILLILDEPTSGLDEGLDRRLMQLLAGLAHEETAIMLVTHSMANLDEADRVLAVNGRKTTGYYGPPQAMLQAFGTQSYADVMDQLRDGQSAAGANPDTRTTGTSQARRTSPSRARRRQIPVLALRELRRFVPSRGPRHMFAKPALHLLLAPLVVALLACLVGSRGLATSPASPNAQLTEVLSLLTITTAFFAAALTSGSIVSDLEMIRREGRWGIRARSVVTSRFLVFGMLAALQGTVASLIFLALRPGPSDGGLMPGPVLMIVTMSLLSLSSAVAGLFVSALARSVQQGVFALMMLSVVQVVLSGWIIPLGQPGNAGIWLLNGLSWVAPIRWATAALGSGIGINSLPGTTADALWTHSLAHVAGAWAALAVLSTVFLAAAAAVLDARLRRRL